MIQELLGNEQQMAEARLYARITLDFADSAKIRPLSDKAFRQYIEALLWSRRMLSDGFIPTKMARILFTEEVLEELTTNDDEKPSLRFVDGGIAIHDFAEHQTTKAVVEQKQANGSKGGKAKAANVSSENVAPARDLVEQNPSESLAKTETETETETFTSKEVNTIGDLAFDKFWSFYPRKIGKGGAKKAWEKITRGVKPELIIEGARRMAADPNLPETQFIPHPSTWLNEGRWDDEPYAPRGKTNLKEIQRQEASEKFLASFSQQPEITANPDWA